VATITGTELFEAGMVGGLASLLSMLAMAYIPPSTAKSIFMHDTPALVQSTASAAIYQAMP